MQLIAVNRQTCNKDGLCRAVCPMKIIDSDQLGYPGTDRAVAVREERIAQAESSERLAREAARLEQVAARRSRVGWVLFVLSVIALFAAVVWVTLRLVSVEA